MFIYYFDFSAYSDMAIGLSRLFGVRLPLNFNSPYKAVNIAQFWRRWHMTLSRFLRDYLYIPLGGNRHGPLRRHANLLTTMVLGGLWHGAGWTFVIWGALHGGFLVVNHVWQGLCCRTRIGLPPGVARVLGIALTFLCAVFAWVYFRAPDLPTANRIVAGMLGYAGAALPEAILARAGPLKSVIEAIGIGGYLGGGASFLATWAWVTVAAMIAFFAPNTQEIMGRFDPALPEAGRAAVQTTRWAWQPGRGQAIAAGCLFAAGVLALARPTEFLYFQF